LYSHFLDEHNLGHHKYLGTPEDPATALRGESVYHFVVRSFIGSHINSLKREIKRLKKTWGNDCPIALLIFSNKMTMYFAIHVTLLTTIYLVLGLSSLKYQLVYTFWGVWYLEVINYIEHYGI
jgi:alkane 1-monooxygenase